MTTSPGTGDPRDLVANMLALTLGIRKETVRVRDWAELCSFSLQHRCAALMWLRSGDVIRSHAPEAVVARWRSLALSVDAEGRALLSVLGDTQRLLSDAEVRSVVLKGPALSLALYGPPIVRPTHDLDLFIPLAQRDAARAVLVRSGWRQVEWDARAQYEVLAREIAGTTVHLDLFSSVPKHLAALDAPPPASIERVVNDVTVRMHWGEGLATYLSVHLAKHEFAPLLWYVDIATHWSALTPVQKEAERRYAERGELGRYLDWAVKRAEALVPAAEREPAALRLLGFTESGRVQPRRVWREIALAATVRGKIIAVLRWIFPPRARTVSAFMRRLIWRLRHLSRYGVEQVPVGAIGSADPLRVKRAVDDAG